MGYSVCKRGRADGAQGLHAQARERRSARAACASSRAQGLAQALAVGPHPPACQAGADEIFAQYAEPCTDIYEKHVKNLPWGGDFPEEAKAYFSPNFLWTRPQEDSVVQVRGWEMRVVTGCAEGLASVWRAEVWHSWG
jgi:hypothetical protein